MNKTQFSYFHGNNEISYVQVLKDTCDHIPLGYFRYLEKIHVSRGKV